MSMLRNSRLSRWIPVVCLLLLNYAGCTGSEDSRPSAEFKGVVSMNGTPLEEGSIQFTSTKTGESAYDNIEAGGAYVIHFDNADVGETYQVTVGPTVIEETDAHALEENPPAPMKVKIPQKYRDRVTSGLSVTLEKAGENEFNFELSM